MNILTLDNAARTGWATYSTSPILLPDVSRLAHGEWVLAAPGEDDRDLVERRGMRLHRYRQHLRSVLTRCGARWLVRYESPIIFAGRPGSTGPAYHYEGVLLELCAELGLPLPRAIDPSSLKKHCTGDGAASKAAMQAFARRRWRLRDDAPLGPDEADALCVLSWALDEIGEE